MLAGPSAAPLPKVIEPLKLVEQRAILQGEIAVAQLPRFSAMLLGDEGVARVQMTFDKDEEGIPVIVGTVDATVSVQCQRCLEPMALDLSAQLSLGIVLSDERASHLPKYYDPLVLEDAELSLWELAEDELLLFLPLVASHGEDVCQVDAKYQQAEGDSSHPFAALQKLKN